MRKRWGFKETEVIPIILNFPDFALLNKRSLLRKKVEYIQKVTKKNDNYIRNIIRRHP